MPALFDRLTAEGGLPMKSFNAGVSSMHTPEDGWYLEQILARKPARLRWVFLEIDFFDTAQILRAGATPILVMPPRTRVLYFVPSAENAGLAPVVDLCRPAQYPELYDLRYRVDTSHFNVAGTEVFTRLAAARFLEIARPPAIH